MGLYAKLEYETCLALHPVREFQRVLQEGINCTSVEAAAFYLVSSVRHYIQADG